MQIFLVLGFVLFVGFFALPGQAGMPGGEQQITEDDKVNVEKAKEMVIEDVEEKHKKDKDYVTSNIVFSDWVITKKVVSGLVYNMKWKTTYNCKATKCNLEEKPSKTENWKASVWFKAGDGKQQYATDGEPKCEDSN